MAGLVGRTLGRYEIVAFVGKGGMGEVFRARDTELGRDVAVKVLPKETAQDEGRLARFKREARAVAQLSHPNILDIHDFGTEDGVSYSVTELLEGSDLRDRLAGHALPISKVQKIGRAVAEGLAAAHTKGIVHRDIKPANIFVTNTGQVKILDFGIAVLRDVVGSDGVDTGRPTKTLTETGQRIGTTAYMSPEQVAGKPADSRSDIFSLGGVLYEMLTGKKAFEAETANETMVAIVSKDPTPISELRSDVPAALDLLVQRCLEKECDERFESARDVAFALEALSDDRVPSGAVQPLKSPRLMRNVRAAAVGAALVIVGLVGWKLLESWLPVTPDLPEKKHIAVIDFEAPSEDPTLTALSDGLTETVSQSLRYLEQQTHGAFWVVPRRHRKLDEPWTVESVAKAHGSTLGLTGRLRSRDGRLSLELDIRRPGETEPLRTTVVEDEIDNLVSFQEAPLVSVAEMLEIQLERDSLDHLRSRSTTVVPALTSYLAGIGRLVRASDLEAALLARQDLEKAVIDDPTFDLARAALFRSCAALIAHDGQAQDPHDCGALLPSPDRYESADISAGAASVVRSLKEDESAVEWMERAVFQRPQDAELQLQLGKDLQKANSLDAAETAFHRSVDLRPDYWEGFYYLGFVDYVRGQYEATANAWRIATRCAPGRSTLFSNLGAVFYYLDRHDQAFPMFEQAIELTEGGSFVALSNLGTLYFDDARYAEAVSTFERALELDDGDSRIWGYLGWSYAAGADPGRAREPFQRALELANAELAGNPEDPGLLARLAGYYGMLDHRDRGLELIERAIEFDPEDPRVMAAVGETLEDLGDRDRALEWIGRALNAGVSRTRFESHPSLRDLVADERYQQIFETQTPMVDSGLS